MEQRLPGAAASVSPRGPGRVTPRRPRRQEGRSPPRRCGPPGREVRGQSRQRCSRPSAHSHARAATRATSQAARPAFPRTPHCTSETITIWARGELRTGGSGGRAGAARSGAAAGGTGRTCCRVSAWAGRRSGIPDRAPERRNRADGRAGRRPAPRAVTGASAGAGPRPQPDPDGRPWAAAADGGARSGDDGACLGSCGSVAAALSRTPATPTTLGIRPFCLLHAKGRSPGGRKDDRALRRAGGVTPWPVRPSACGRGRRRTRRGPGRTGA